MRMSMHFDAGSGTGSGRETDAQLLEHFVSGHDQAAFAELVARHGACVWAVCLRVLGQEQDAEDAFQAVFLILGRKAAVIRKRESVASWLHGVALRTALKLRRAIARRRAREQHARGAAGIALPPEQVAARELQDLLDQEVARLKEKYRTPFVLCCLEGLTRVEAAQELGWTTGTVASRLARARRMLEKRLAQRGFTLSALLSAGVLVEGAFSAAAPPALMQAAIHAGVTGNAAAVFSPAAVTLAQSILHALLITKLKAVLVTSLFLALATAAAGFAAIQLWSPQEGKAADTAREVHNELWSAVVSHDGKLVAAGDGWWDRPGEVGVWDMTAQKRVMHVMEPKGVASVAFSPDGKLLASGSWTHEVRLRTVPAGTEVAVFKIPGLSFVAFSPDGALLAVATEAGIVQLMDVAQRETLCTLEGDLFRFHCIAFSPDGKRLLAGGGDWKKGGRCQVTIWDVASKKQVGKLVGHELAVSCITFSPDGKLIATGGLDQTICLWNARTEAQIKVLRGHRHWVECLAFSPEGKTLVSGGRDGALRFWEVDTGRQAATLGSATRAQAPFQGEKKPDLARPWGFATSVRAVQFTPDGAKLLVGGGPRTLRLFDTASRKETAVLWESPPPELLPAEQAELTARSAPADKNPAAPDKVNALPRLPASELPERVEIRFNQGLEAFPDLHLFGPDAAASVQADPQGIRITLPAERHPLDGVGLEARKTLHADFEVTLAYELIALPDPGPPWGAGVVLETWFDTPEPSKARLARTQKEKNAFFGSTYYRDANASGSHPLKYPLANAKVRTGQLRLVRTGTLLAFQIEEGNKGFQTIATQEVGAADVSAVRAFATSGFQPLPVDLRLVRLDLRAAKIAAGPADPLPSRGWLVAGATITILLGVALAILHLVVRQRRRTGKGAIAHHQ